MTVKVMKPWLPNRKSTALQRSRLSFGQLYHDGDVVFGEAMVDAYTLEDKVANTPRIVVSDRVIARLPTSNLTGKSMLLQDVDGVLHLDYFTKMAETGLQPTSGEPAATPLWATTHLDLVQKEIDALRARADATSLEQAAKWEWFKRSLEEAIKKVTA